MKMIAVPRFCRLGALVYMNSVPIECLSPWSCTLYLRVAFVFCASLYCFFALLFLFDLGTDDYRYQLLFLAMLSLVLDLFLPFPG